MSETVVSTGFMAKLTSYCGDYKTEEWEELCERLDGVCMKINYEGTIVYSDNRSEDFYGLTIGSIKEDGLSSFVETIRSLGISIIEKSIKPYSCVWYNGADSDMSELTLSKFEAS